MLSDLSHLEVAITCHICALLVCPRLDRLFSPAAVHSAGGARNATIVSEYVQTGGKLYQATGLDALINRTTALRQLFKTHRHRSRDGVIVVGINRTVWKKLQALANERCRCSI